MKYIYTTLILVFFYLHSHAQYGHTPVHSSDSGQVLITKLVQDYKPVISYTYGQARDYMFKNVYRENDSVECVYTGLRRYLGNTGDPSVIMYDNASTQSIDTEHTYPQNKVTNDAGRSDLHHMFPTRARANNARGSVRFDIVPDNSVDKWFRGNTEITSSMPPAAERPFYSKLNNNVGFEPRDEHKGNVARAMFYFYTMYKGNADAADVNFFRVQLSDLCQWHLDDPVDSLEWIRTSRIAFIQQNKVNPFVLDCTLPQRTYCSGISCTPPNTTVSVDKKEAAGLLNLSNYPNPFSHQTTITYELEKTQEVVLEVFDHLGRKIETLVAEEQNPGLYTVDFDANNHSTGIYYYRMSLAQNGKSLIFAKKMVINK
jgi:endonuclease I